MNKRASLLIFSVLIVLLSSGFASAAGYWDVDATYTKRIPFNCTYLTDGTPIISNSSTCFEIDNKKQVVWTYCSGTGTAIYKHNSTDYTEYIVANDTHQLPFEVEFGNGTSYLPESVYDTNYTLVDLLKDTTTSTTSDSTSYGNDGTKTGANSPLEVDGKIYKGQYYDDTLRQISYGNALSLNTPNAITIEFWLNNTAKAVNGLINKETSWWIRTDVNRKVIIRFYINTVLKQYTSTTALTDGTFQHIFIIWNDTDSNITLFIDGVKDAGSPFAATGGTLDTTANVLQIGKISETDQYAKGVVDNFRLSNISRSFSYANQSYQNAIGTSGYGDLGAEESAPSGGAPTVTAHTTSPTIVYTNTDFKFNMTATDSDNASFMGYVQFYINGSASGSTVSQAIGNNTNTLIGTLANVNFNKGATLIAEYWAGDGEENTTKANQSTVTVQNILPTITANATSPSTVYTNTDFKLNLTITDLDGDSLTGYVQFYVNGSVSGAVQSQSALNDTNTLIGTLANADFGKGATLIAEFWAGDGEDNITKENATQATVQNTAPTTPTTLTLNTTIKVNEELTAAGSGSTDPDGDSLTYYYVFYNVDDSTERQAYSTDNTYLIQLSDVHDKIRVRTKAYDGTAYSGEKEANITVSSTAPDSPVLVSPANNSVNNTDAVNLSVTVTNDDGDLMNVSFYNHSIIYTNCSDAKAKGQTTDGNYTIKPGDTIFEVYCANMSTDTPKEFLNLEVIYGINNYIYHKRIPWPVGETWCNWEKVQLINLTGDIEINTTNHDFRNCSYTGEFHDTPYGAANACNGNTYGNPGYFNVTLTSTPFRVNWEGGVNWELLGAGPVGAITTNESDGIIVGGYAEGNCGTFSPKNPPGLILTFQDDYVSPSVNIGNDTNIANGSTATYEWTDLAEGTYYWYAVVTNSYGESTTSDIWTFTLDGTNPSLSITTSNNAYWSTLPTINGTASDANSDTIYSNNTDWTWNNDYSNWGFLNNTNIAQGTYHILITANDTFGNTNSSLFVFTYDSINPALTITTGNNTINNTIVTIEGTASDTNPDTIYSNNTAWSWNSDYSNWAFTNNTAISDGVYHILITANDSAGNTQSSLFVFTYDTVSPTITINPNNAFTATNTSTIDNYQSTEFPLNITFADERDLFAMEINITNSTGHTIFNHTNTSLSGLSYTYTNTLNNTAWAKGLYNIEVIVSDSHTANKIDDYKTIKEKDRITYETAEGNEIAVEAEGAIGSDSLKKYDSYDFQFDYLDTTKEKLVYHLKTKENKIYYRTESSYIAHFIVWNEETNTGNWIDFEDVGLTNYTVEKVNDNHYIITFSLPEESKKIKKVKFKSIGGLNIVTENYEWFRGSTTQTYTDPILTNTTTSFYLDVTNTSTISNIDARFFYNYTEYSVTETTSDDYNFVATITVPTVETGSQPFNFSWNVSINQTDSTQYNFSELNTQTVSTAQINITIRDELNQSLITETLNVFIVNEGRVYSTSTGYILIGNLTAGIPYIEIENSNYPRRGYYITISENITTHLTAYLLRSSAATQEVIFTVQSSDLDKIEDAKMTFYKMINMSYVAVGQIETDYAGQAALTLDTTNEYRIVIEATGYPIKTLNLRPLQTAYTITLQITGAGFENVFEGIAYTITPTNRSTNVSQSYTDFRLDIYSSNSDLELFGVRTFGHSYTCIPASCTQNITGSAAGGSAIVRVKGNTTGTVKIDVYYKRIDYPITYLNFNIYSFVEALLARASSLWESMKTVKSEYSPIMLALIAIIGTIMMLGTAAEIGIYGLPLIIIASFGLIFFAMVGFIHPLIVGLSLILGGIVYFRFSGGAD